MRVSPSSYYKPFDSYAPDVFKNDQASIYVMGQLYPSTSCP